jgi:hypothetical protein
MSYDQVEFEENGHGSHKNKFEVGRTLDAKVAGNCSYTQGGFDEIRHD